MPLPRDGYLGPTRSCNDGYRFDMFTDRCIFEHLVDSNCYRLGSSTPPSISPIAIVNNVVDDGQIYLPGENEADKINSQSPTKTPTSSIPTNDDAADVGQMDLLGDEADGNDSKLPTASPMEDVQATWPQPSFSEGGSDEDWWEDTLKRWNTSQQIAPTIPIALVVLLLCFAIY